MPPSPSLRRSPRGDPRGDSHKRGQSLEHGVSFKERDDDDLALFNEMQSRERDNFLLESTDDFEDLLSSKMKPFLDFKLGINIPARGEGSDLLNADGDKNDYEWLLTPPETPLFPSLDDEPTPINLVHSGRARSRPISISRSSTMEKSHRSRGSPSPQRSSPSPRSGTSTFHGRPSSAPHSNPGLLRSTSPSQRLSPTPVKSSTPPPRSSTPTSRRTSVGSVGMSGTRGTSPVGIRGTSPVRTNRGNSASPKVRAWQSNIPGFSLEAPPNLRTSLADRPASYVRGSSPASRTSRDSSSKFGRHSMSPTTSRSISSSHSLERDRLSSYSKGSIASSGDDDADSLQSVHATVSVRPMSRKGVSGYPSGRPMAFSKKPTKTFSPSSAPKRSFDSATRQTDRKTPPNMFRPLLSSVPSSTFYSGKPSAAHRTLISRNSSVTTSSNASSDLATSAALDTEGSDQYQDDRASDCARATFSGVHEEVFVLDKIDARPENTEHESHDVSSEAECGEPGASLPVDSEKPVQGDVMIADCDGNAVTCSICDNLYCPDELTKSEDKICFECKKKELLRCSSLLNRVETTDSSSGPLMDNSEESHIIPPVLSLPQLDATLDDSQSRDASEIAQHQGCTPEVSHHDGQHSRSNLENSLPESMEPESMDVISKQQVTTEHRTLDDPCYTTSGGSDMNINVAEGTGISVLLNRSSSVKGPIVHGRTINSSAISFDDLFYARDLTSSMRSSIGHGSFSASSSLDLTSARQREMFMRRQLSGKLSDSNSKPHSTVSSFSGTSFPVYQGVRLSTSSHDGSMASPSDQVVTSENPSLARAPVTEAEISDIPMSSQEKDASLLAGCMSSTEVVNVALKIDEERQDVGQSGVAEASLAEEGAENRSPQVDVADDPHRCSLSTMSEIELSDSHPSSPRSQIDVVFREDLEDSSAGVHHDTDVKEASLESAESDHTDRIVEESTVTMDDQEGTRTKGLTLEEATDTILFCNSIIHDLAYKAASIAIEKEKENLEPFEGSRPTVTIPDKSTSDRKDPRRFSSSRTPKTRKYQKKRTEEKETETKPPLTQNKDKSNVSVVRNIGIPNNRDSLKPTKLESKCNCTIM